MVQPISVSVDLGSSDCVWIGLHDFDVLSLGMMPLGANVYHEFAKQRLRRMGFPELLVEAGRYRLQPE